MSNHWCLERNENQDIASLKEKEQWQADKDENEFLRKKWQKFGEDFQNSMETLNIVKILKSLKEQNRSIIQMSLSHYLMQSNKGHRLTVSNKGYRTIPHYKVQFLKYGMKDYFWKPNMGNH